MSTLEQETETEAEPEAEAEPSPQESRMDAKRARAEAQERERQAREEVIDADESVTLKVFRYDPEVEGKEEPRFDDFTVPFHKGMTVLDALIYARDHYDSSLTFRHSCRQAV